MKCSLSDIEGLSLQIENLGNLGPEQLDQAWRDLFNLNAAAYADESLGSEKSNRRPQTFHSPPARALGQERVGARPLG